MTLEKAIEIKSRTGYAFMNTNPHDMREADRLSIEALKLEKRYRKKLGASNIPLLQGETL